MRRFRGEGLNKVDSKGRVSIPALFRRVIESCDPGWTDGLQPELVSRQLRRRGVALDELA